MTTMSPTEFRDKMLELAGDSSACGEHHPADEEYAHSAVDELMCELLTSLGYEAGITIFRNTYKWYA